MTPGAHDGEAWEALRVAGFPSERINLNPGTLGTPSAAVRRAMQQFQAEEDGAWPLGQYVRGRDALRRARARATALWGHAPAICAGTTQTMNLLTLALPGLLQGSPAREGPIRVLTTAQEHHGGVSGFEHHPAYRTVYLAEHELTDDAAFRARVRRESPAVALLSQRTWTDGRALDVARMCASLREEAPDCVRIVDAAQAVGIVAPALGIAEIVVASAHKWLNGPPGTGFVWMSPEAHARFGRLHHVGEPLDPEGPCPGLEMAGGQDFAVYAGLDAALELYAQIGLEAVLTRSCALAALLVEQLAAVLPGVAVDAADAVVRVRFPEGRDPYPLYAGLNARGVHTKCVKETLADGTRLNLLRLGVPWYESPARLARVSGLVSALVGEIHG